MATKSGTGGRGRPGGQARPAASGRRPAGGSKPVSQPARTPEPDPTPAPPTSSGNRAAAIVRLAWLPLVLGLVAAVAIAAWSGTTVGSTTDGVVNTRAASSQPNERVDLINDLSTLPQITAVMAPVADDAGMSTAELRDALRITRIESSTLIRISLTTSDGTDDDRRAVLESFLAAAREYLQPPSPSPAMIQAQAQEDAAIDAYFAAIAAADGQSPSNVLTRLDQSITEARRAGDLDRVAALQARVPAAVEGAKEFAKLTAGRDRASANLEAVAQAEAETSATGPASLELTFLDNDGGRDGITSAVALRRGLAAGVAVAVLVGALVVLLGRRRRLPGAP